ncbi:MAG: hypothetical protein EPN30_02380 [Actinomycetota bacterium]|nr:MAG: hypothetical protein EPN30_02380 [Actinomycetota bacterium]
MQTNVRETVIDEHMFVYNNESVRDETGGRPVAALQGAVLKRQDSPERLQVVYGTGSRGRIRGGPSVLNALRNTIILGVISVLVLCAYSIGVSMSHSSLKTPSAGSLPHGWSVSYTVRPGDSAWSIASKVAPSPSEVPFIAREIFSEQGFVLLPGTVLNLTD